MATETFGWPLVVMSPKDCCTVFFFPKYNVIFSENQFHTEYGPECRLAVVCTFLLLAYPSTQL